MNRVDPLLGLVGSGPWFERLRETVREFGPSECGVLITGESGTGKELVALAFHRASGRRALVPVNCAALPEHLVESEMFGHVRGAFTGADQPRKGVFQEADGGTLFLDEVGELPLPVQAALLRALDSGEVRRVGSSRHEETRVRVVAATNRELGAELKKGSFRDDFYWRLQTVRIDIPPSAGTSMGHSAPRSSFRPGGPFPACCDAGGRRVPLAR